MSLYLSDENGNLIKISGNKSVSNRALLDASNLTNTNINSWKNKLNIGEIYSNQLSNNSSDNIINLSLSNGIYKLQLRGTTNTNLDLVMIFNGVSKTTYGSIWSSYNAVAPTNASDNHTDFLIGIGGTSYTIIDLTITINDGTVIVENNSVANSSGTTYRRNAIYFADGYGTVNSLKITTNNSSWVMNAGFIYKLYKIG